MVIPALLNPGALKGLIPQAETESCCLSRKGWNLNQGLQMNSQKRKFPSTGNELIHKSTEQESTQPLR